MTPDEKAEREHCERLADEYVYGEESMDWSDAKLSTHFASLLLSERQAARAEGEARIAELEARVRELEAVCTEAADQHNRFDYVDQNTRRKIVRLMK